MLVLGDGEQVSQSHSLFIFLLSLCSVLVVFLLISILLGSNLVFQCYTIVLFVSGLWYKQNFNFLVGSAVAELVTVLSVH